MSTKTSFPLDDNAIDAITASLWLVAGNKLEQAIIILHSSIELLLKSELARIHPVLIADNKKLDYETLKSILKDEIEKHHRGSQLNIPIFSMEKTITFLDTIDRIDELYPEIISKWGKGLKRLNHTRNQLIHSGSQKSEKTNYIELISTFVFQFLDEFLLTSRNLELKNIISENVYRELQVAKTLFEKLKSNNYTEFGYVLKTVTLAVLFNNVSWPKLDGGHLGMSEGDESIILSEWEEIYLNTAWKNAKRIRTSCRICDSYSAFVKFDTKHPPDSKESPVAVRCSDCGLAILETETYLAEIHVGDISSSDS
jgi:hypothetical protein